MSDQEPELTTPSAPAAPAGWYDDPASGQKRYWDGTTWAAAAPAAPSVTKPPIKPLALFALIVGGIAFLLGLVPVLGLIFALGAIALAVIAIVKKQAPTWMAAVGGGLGGVAFLTSVIVLVALGSGISNAGVSNVAAPTNSPSPSASSAPTPEPSPTPTPVAVPKVTGMTVSEALATLRAAGFDASSDADPSWKVTDQKPSAGADALPGTEVKISAEFDKSAYDKISSRTWSQISKDPDSAIGKQVRIYGQIVQFDSFTGKCSFRANTAANKQNYSFDYDVNTLITAGDGNNDCPILDKFVQDDHVAMYVTILGSYEYDTTIGGTATAVLASVERITLLPDTEY